MNENCKQIIKALKILEHAYRFQSIERYGSLKIIIKGAVYKPTSKE